LVQTTADLEAQLRQRLRYIALIAAAAFAVMAATGLFPALSAWLADPGRLLTEPPCYGPMLLVAAVEAAVAVWLAPGRPVRLGRLRLLEGLALGSIAAFFAWNGTLNFLGNVPDLGKRPRGMAGEESIAWVVQIVLYGVLIPNSGRRCAAGVALLALLGLVPDLVVLAGQGAAGGPAAVYVLTKGIWLGVAAAIVVYGAFRVETLRHEALQARRLGPYLLKRQLGQGGMGEVHLAEHTLLRRPCAVKLIRPERAGDPRDLARFEREVRTTATLTHPNTVQIFDYGRAEDGTFYYVMEYLPGLSLEELVSRHGPLAPARAIHFLRQLCGALREAHAVGLIHRDLKPGNVMVCERGGLFDVAKLLDFGLVRAPGPAAADSRLTYEGTLTGTPAYMSPEQAAGQEGLDARCDIYGLGALAYFVLTGGPPFGDRSPVKTLAAHLYEAPAPPSARRPEVPADLEAVVLRCLAKDPAERFADVEALDAALAGCAAAGAWTQAEAARWWRERRPAGGGELAGPADGSGTDTAHGSNRHGQEF
jgi:serine/threonine-protein kinase